MRSVSISQTFPKLLEELLGSGENKVLCAVLGAPEFLSGMTKGERAHFTRLYNEKNAPEATRRLNATRKAIDVLRRAAPIAFNQTEKAMRGTWTLVEKLRHTDTEAKKALLMKESELP